MMIWPGVFLLSGFAYQIHQNVYGIDFAEEKQMVLIDCGLDLTDLEVVKRVVNLWGLTDRKVTEVFLTHSHFDHAGNAAYFADKGATIYAGEEDAESIRRGDEHTIWFAYGREFPVCRDVRTLRDGDKISLPQGSSLRCIHTPGHTRGSMCYELFRGGKRVLFTGDFVQTGEGDGTARLGIRVDSSYSSQDYLASLQKLLKVESDILLPGHFRPYLQPAAKLIQAAYREMLVNREHYMDN